MQAVEAALEPLEAEERKRVINWAAQKYGISEAKNSADVEEPNKPQRAAVRRRKARLSPSPDQQNEGPTVPIKDIVNLIRSHDRAETIEKTVLDSSDQLSRVLLSLFIVHTGMNDQFSLSARDITAILRQLNVSIAQENVSKMLRERGARFVMIDSEGPSKRFKLSRRGAAYMEDVLSSVHSVEGDTSKPSDLKPKPEELN